MKVGLPTLVHNSQIKKKKKNFKKIWLGHAKLSKGNYFAAQKQFVVFT